MSEHHGGHHGGDMGGSQGFGGPPDMPGASDGFRDSPTFSTYRRGGRAGFRYRPRRGSLGWVVLVIVRLAILALFAFVAYHIIHGVGTPSP